MYFTTQLKESAGTLTFRQIILIFALLIVFVGQVSAYEEHTQVDDGPIIFKREEASPTLEPREPADADEPVFAPIINKRGDEVDHRIYKRGDEVDHRIYKRGDEVDHRIY